MQRDSLGHFCFHCLGFLPRQQQSAKKLTYGFHPKITLVCSLKLLKLRIMGHLQHNFFIINLASVVLFYKLTHSADLTLPLPPPMSKALKQTRESHTPPSVTHMPPHRSKEAARTHKDRPQPAEPPELPSTWKHHTLPVQTCLMKRALSHW